MTLNFPSFSILLLFTTPATAAAAAAAASAGQTIDIKVELPPATSDGAQAQLDVLDDLGSGRVVTDERRSVRRLRRPVVPLQTVDVARRPLRLSDGVVAHHEVLKVARRIPRKLDPAAAHVSGVAPRDHILPFHVVRERAEVGE